MTTPYYLYGYSKGLNESGGYETLMSGMKSAAGAFTSITEQQKKEEEERKKREAEAARQAEFQRGFTGGTSLFEPQNPKLDVGPILGRPTPEPQFNITEDTVKGMETRAKLTPKPQEPISSVLPNIPGQEVSADVVISKEGTVGFKNIKTKPKEDENKGVRQQEAMEKRQIGAEQRAAETKKQTEINKVLNSIPQKYAGAFTGNDGEEITEALAILNTLGYNFEYEAPLLGKNYISFTSDDKPQKISPADFIRDYKKLVIDGATKSGLLTGAPAAAKSQSILSKPVQAEKSQGTKVTIEGKNSAGTKVKLSDGTWITVEEAKRRGL